MAVFKQIIFICDSVLSIQISLFGYSFTLYSVLLFGSVGYLLLYLLFRLWK